MLVSEDFLWHQVSVFSLLQERPGVWSPCPPVPILLSAQFSYSDNRTGMLLALKSDPSGSTPSLALFPRQTQAKYLLL